MGSSDYSILLTANDSISVNVVAEYKDQTANGFTATMVGVQPNDVQDSDFSVAVFATNALPPTGGTGTDAWGSVNADSSVNASFNIERVSQTEKWDGTTVSYSAGYYYVKFTTPMPTDQYSVQMNMDSDPNDFLKIY